MNQTMLPVWWCGAGFVMPYINRTVSPCYLETFAVFFIPIVLLGTLFYSSDALWHISELISASSSSAPDEQQQHGKKRGSTRGGTTATEGLLVAASFFQLLMHVLYLGLALLVPAMR